MNGRTRCAALLAALALAAGCSDDACRGRSETCLSLTLLGDGGVTAADQLQIVLKKNVQPHNPMTPLGSAQALPFKVAVLWPDGPGTISVRSFQGGVLNGVTAELAVDLRGGAHAKRVLTLYPPLSGGDLDLGERADLRMPDLARPPDLASGDLRMPPDLSMPVDLAVPPADMSPPADLAMPPADMSPPADAATDGTAD